MATVTGVTKARADAIEAASVVGASIQGNDLVLVTKGGTQINVGRIIPPIINGYPVGTIYFTDRSANPSTYMGGGTWVRWGRGRVPVGLDESDTTFDSIEETGGQKTYAMTLNEMPWHNHGGITHDQDRDHTHSGYAHPNGQHTHGEYRPYNRTVANGQATGADSSGYVAQTDPAGWHDHSVTTYGASQTHAHGINGQGGSTPVTNNNLQPFITCYIWKRTA